MAFGGVGVCLHTGVQKSEGPASFMWNKFIKKEKNDTNNWAEFKSNINVNRTDMQWL